MKDDIPVQYLKKSLSNIKLQLRLTTSNYNGEEIRHDITSGWRVISNKDQCEEEKR